MMTAEIDELLRQRERYRAEKNYAQSDRIRSEIEKRGFLVEDRPEGAIISEKPDVFYYRSHDVFSNLAEPNLYRFSLSLVVNTPIVETLRLLKSILAAYRHPVGLEVLVVENTLEPASRGVLSDLSRGRWEEYLPEFKERAQAGLVKVFLSGAKLGEAAARNLTFRAARGRFLIVADSSVEITGNVFQPIERVLREKSVGLAGPFGLVSSDLHSFREIPESREGEVVEVDAEQLYSFAFRRELLKTVGLMNEKFKFYRHLDLDFSLQVKDKGFKIVNLRLPVLRHRHTAWENLSESERERKSRKNFYLFLNRWYDRIDLLHHESH